MRLGITIYAWTCTQTYIYTSCHKKRRDSSVSFPCVGWKRKGIVGGNGKETEMGAVNKRTGNGKDMVIKRAETVKKRKAT